MKFEIGKAIEGALSVATGAQAGKIAGRQEQERRELQDFQQRLNVFQTESGLRQQQFSNEVTARQARARSLREMAQNPRLTPQSQQELLKKALELENEAAEYQRRGGAGEADLFRRLLEGHPYGRRFAGGPPKLPGKKGAEMFPGGRPGGLLPGGPGGMGAPGGLGETLLPLPDFGDGGAPVPLPLPHPGFGPGGGVESGGSGGGAGPGAGVGGSGGGPILPLIKMRGANYDSLRQQLGLAMEDAYGEGWTSRYSDLSRLLGGLESGDLTEEQVRTKLDELGPIGQGEPLRQWANFALGKLTGWQDDDSIAGGAQAEADELVAELEDAMSAFPLDPARVEKAREKFLAFRKHRGNFQPGQRRRDREQAEKGRQEAAVRAKNQEYTLAIQQAVKDRDHGEFWKLVEQQREFAGKLPPAFKIAPLGTPMPDRAKKAKTPRLISAAEPVVPEHPFVGKTWGARGGPEVSDPPAWLQREIALEETDEEQNARRTLGARDFVQGDAEKQQLTRWALADLERVFAGNRWKELHPGQRLAVLERMADLSEELQNPILFPQGLPLGDLSPEEQRFVKERAESSVAGQRRAFEIESIEDAARSQYERGSLSAGELFDTRKLKAKLQTLHAEAVSLQRRSRDSLTPAQRKRLDDLTRPGGGIDQLRGQIQQRLGVGGGYPGGAPQPSAGFDPRYYEAWKQALGWFKKMYGFDPSREQARQLYDVVAGNGR